jgi:CRISPR-associated protein Csd2
MGRKEIVPYGLYRAHGFVSPQLAAQTGCTTADLELFWQAIERMFEFDRSAARGEMTTQRLVIFEHDSALGNARAHRLFERVHVTRRDPSRPPRRFDDYEVVIDTVGLPAGIQAHVRG